MKKFAGAVLISAVCAKDPKDGHVLVYKDKNCQGTTWDVKGPVWLTKDQMMAEAGIENDKADAIRVGKYTTFYAYEDDGF